MLAGLVSWLGTQFRFLFFVYNQITKYGFGFESIRSMLSSVFSAPSCYGMEHLSVSLSGVVLV